MSWYWDFLGGPEVEIFSSNVGDVDLILGPGAKISHALGPKQNKTKQNHHNPMVRKMGRKEQSPML